METLAKKLLAEKRQKAIDMVGKKLEVQVASKALSIDEKNFTVEFVMSTETVDRHGDIIDQETWMLEHFRKNPMFFLQHNSYEFPIGQWLPETVKLEADPNNPGRQRLVGTALFRVKYDDAARAFDHVKEGDMNMVSVGFIPHRVDYDEARDAFILFDCELLECSLVGIGSNRQALVKEGEDARTLAIESKEALEVTIKTSTYPDVVRALRTRELLNKAIRNLSIPTTT